MKKKYSKAYLSYLKSKHWQNLREERFLLCKRKCERCKKNKPLDGHHIRYRNPLESCTVDDIMALCRECHSFLHDEIRKRGAKIPNSQDSTRFAISIFAGERPITRKSSDCVAFFDAELLRKNQSRLGKIVSAIQKQRFSKDSLRDAISQLQEWLND